MEDKIYFDLPMPDSLNLVDKETSRDVLLSNGVYMPFFRSPGNIGK
jgi:hypothetical protein